MDDLSVSRARFRKQCNTEIDGYLALLMKKMSKTQILGTKLEKIPRQPERLGKAKRKTSTGSQLSIQKFPISQVGSFAVLD